MSLKASVRLELSTSAWKFCPVERPADPSLERYFDGVTAKIGGAVEAARREKRLSILNTSASDVVEFCDRYHRRKRLLT